MSLNNIVTGARHPQYFCNNQKDMWYNSNNIFEGTMGGQWIYNLISQ